MRLGHARGLACAKTKKFPCIFLASPPPTPPPRSGKEMERKFLVLLRRFSLRKEQSFLTFLIALFSTLTATEAPCYPRLVVTPNSVPPTTDSDNSLKWSLAIQNSLRNGEAQILYVFAPPSRAHTSSPELDSMLQKNAQLSQWSFFVIPKVSFYTNRLSTFYRVRIVFKINYILGC